MVRGNVKCRRADQDPKALRIAGLFKDLGGVHRYGGSGTCKVMQADIRIPGRLAFMLQMRHQKDKQQNQATFFMIIHATHINIVCDRFNCFRDLLSLAITRRE